MLDLKISEEHRNPDALIAAHAALDALATFGSMTSPLVTFDIEGGRFHVPAGAARRGFVDLGSRAPIRAKRWKHVYVAARP